MVTVGSNHLTVKLVSEASTSTVGPLFPGQLLSPDLHVRVLDCFLGEILQVLLGDMGAGKSSIALRFVKGQYLEFQESTIGAAFFSQTLAVNDASFKLEIWDTAGQERYHCLAPMYYRGAAAAIIVYDITRLDSFAKAKKWVGELQRQGGPNMVTALAGNKVDLEDKRKVATKEARAYAEENGLFFMETSAKTAINVNDMFFEIARRLPRAQPAQNPKGMVLSDRPAEKPGTSTCCF